MYMYELHHSHGPTLNHQWQVIWDDAWSWRGCPWSSWSVSTVLTPGWAVPFLATAAVVTVAERKRVTLLLHFFHETRETSVWVFTELLVPVFVTKVNVSPPLLSPRTSTDVVVWPKWLLSRSREDTHSASWTIIISWNNSKWSQPYALLPLCNIYEYLFVMQKCHLSCKPCNCHPVLVLTTSPFWSPCILLCWRNPPQSLWVSAATRCLRSADVIPRPPSYVSVNKPAFEPHPSVHFLSLVGSSDLKTL